MKNTRQFGAGFGHARRGAQRPARPAPDLSAAQGRMEPVQHSGLLPWLQLRNALFHPSIYRKMIGRVDPAAKNGDLVAVYDRDGKRFGTGLLSTQSQIGLRMLSFDDAAMDESFLSQRLEAAVRLRREVLQLDAVTDACRVVHAEGDALPALIVDRYGDYAVAELFSYPMYRRRDAIATELKRILGVKQVLVRADERVRDAEGFTLGDESPAGPKAHRSPDRMSTIITENKVRFQIDLTHGHKTGFFCDQRENRLALTQFTAGAQVLDLCCYSGGFGIYALALGNAAHVTAVDLDEDAIALAQRNANLNKIPRSAYETIHNDTFVYLRQAQAAQKQFGVVVLDPPKLIPAKEDFFEGRGKYFDMNKLALGCVNPGGMLVTCSCSGLLSPEEFLSMLRGAARSAGRRVQVLRATGPGPDHPFMTECPESSYLKCLWCRVW
jgi:23S rRNA (cytosine1962-C5)-methyltransferase